MLFQKNKLPRFTYKKKSNISFDKIIHHLINNLILEMIDWTFINSNGLSQMCFWKEYEILIIKMWKLF